MESLAMGPGDAELQDTNIQARTDDLLPGPVPVQCCFAACHSVRLVRGAVVTDNKALPRPLRKEQKNDDVSGG